MKLQAQVNRLREELDIQRKQREELSQEVLQDARNRLQQLQTSVCTSNLVTKFSLKVV